MKLGNLFDRLPFASKQKQEAEASLIVEEAKLKAKEERLRGQEEGLRLKKEAEAQARRVQQQAQDQERRLKSKEHDIDLLKVQLEADKLRVATQFDELKKKRDEILLKLEKVAKLSQSEAKELILKAWEDRMKSDVADRIRKNEEIIKLDADKKAQEILIDSMRHGATDYIAEYTQSSVPLPDDSFKGRIIGKDGRNIRAFEDATGVDVDFDEEGVIKISSFDALKREVAKKSLERLLKDGRIQPVRIEEVVRQTQNDIDKVMLQAGEDLVHRVGVYDLPQELVQLLGRFKYRYSYGQNMILHTLEETKIGIALANELKADVMVVKLGCLFHDIGKVVEGKEGSHVDLGVEVLRKYNIPEAAVHCVASSHEDIPFESMEAIIVHIADGISGARPGARHEDFDQYLKRIKDIEEIANTKQGVKDSYALQAGRELRVVVKGDIVSEDDAVILSQKIRDEINEKFPVFPGQVTITVIRETRAVAVSHS